MVMALTRKVRLSQKGEIVIMIEAESISPVTLAGKSEMEGFQNMVGQDSINRFDKTDNRKRKKHSRNGNPRRDR